MAEPPEQSPFRPEALAAHAAGPQANVRSVQLRRRTVAAAAWGLLALGVAGIVFTFAYRVNEYETGPAMVNGSEVTAALPERLRGQLRAGQPVRVQLKGRSPLEATLEELSAPSGSAQLLEAARGEPMLQLRARLPASSDARGEAAVVSVVVGSSSVASFVMPWLRAR